MKVSSNQLLIVATCAALASCSKEKFEQPAAKQVEQPPTVVEEQVKPTKKKEESGGFASIVQFKKKEKKTNGFQSIVQFKNKDRGNKPELLLTSLNFDRSDRKSKVGNAQLEALIKSAIDYQRLEQLFPHLKNELYLPIKGSNTMDSEVTSMTSNQAWSHALALSSLLEKLPLDAIHSKLETDPQARAFYHWLFTHPEALYTFVGNISEHDNLATALELWQDIHNYEKADNPEHLEKYLHLAIATVLVHDSSKLTPSNNDESSSNEVLDRYLIFKDNAERGRLKTRLSSMDVSDLIWVIDVPVSNKEIEWAVKKAHFRRKKWGKAYPHIKYLMERAVSGLNPYKEYTFAEIEKHGGICGDQAYFSVNTAKANGIPATTIVGFGNRGGHAWMAYKPKDTIWDTSTGRYEDYTNGSLTHPQTNQKYAEFDLMLLSDRDARISKIKKAKSILLANSLLEHHKHKSEDIKSVYLRAIKSAPLYAPSWNAYVAYLQSLDEKEVSVKEWAKLASRMENTFKEHPSMWLTAQDIRMDHALKGADEKAINNTQNSFRRELARKFPKRGDLIRAAIIKQEELLASDTPFPKVRSFYRELYRLFGSDTINYKFISQRYFARTSEFSEQRKIVVDDIKKFFTKNIDKESSDYFKAKTEIEIMTMISGLYEQINLPKHAARLAREVEKRRKKSEKKAS